MANTGKAVAIPESSSPVRVQSPPQSEIRIVNIGGSDQTVQSKNLSIINTRDLNIFFRGMMSHIKIKIIMKDPELLANNWTTFLKMLITSEVEKISDYSSSVHDYQNAILTIMGIIQQSNPPEHVRSAIVCHEGSFLFDGTSYSFTASVPALKIAKVAYEDKEEFKLNIDREASFLRGNTVECIIEANGSILLYKLSHDTARKAYYGNNNIMCQGVIKNIPSEKDSIITPKQMERYIKADTDIARELLQDRP
ncbi:TPA_asm: M [Gleditsia betacytorhabdovirus 1]|nr:TPA_asm: M [Gleditsia betacytorhabdovirus 1]